MKRQSSNAVSLLVVSLMAASPLAAPSDSIGDLVEDVSIDGVKSLQGCSVELDKSSADKAEMLLMAAFADRHFSSISGAEKSSIEGSQSEINQSSAAQLQSLKVHFRKLVVMGKRYICAYSKKEK